MSIAAHGKEDEKKILKKKQNKRSRNEKDPIAVDRCSRGKSMEKITPGFLRFHPTPLHAIITLLARLRNVAG